MNDVHFKRVRDDDFRAADPDSLMASVSRSDLGRTFAWSVAFHLAAILLLSLGNMALCVKYRTVNLRQATALSQEAAREEQARLKAEDTQRRKQEILAKADAAAPVKGQDTSPSAGADTADGTADPDTPDVIRETTEVSDQRPESSSLDSIDDLLGE